LIDPDDPDNPNNHKYTKLSTQDLALSPTSKKEKIKSFLSRSVSKRTEPPIKNKLY
jgi:hypothetical protein